MFWFSLFQIMIDKLLQEFAEENFGDQEGNFIPVVYGRIQEIKLFTLLVKEQRPFYERPFKRYKLTTLAGLEKYVADGKDKFLESLNKHIEKDDHGIVLKKENEDEKAASR